MVGAYNRNGDGSRIVQLRRQQTTSLDQFIRAENKPNRYIEVNRLRGSQVDDKVKLRRLLDRDFGRFDASKYLDDHPCQLAEDARQTGPLCQQAAFFSHFR